MPRKRKSAAAASSSGATAAAGDHLKPDLPVIQDSRFAAIHNDPRFIPISKKQVKVKVDKRFKDHIASNAQEFLAGPPVDKFGRPRATTNKEDLERYYDFDSDSEASGSEDDDGEKTHKDGANGKPDAQAHEVDEHAIARRRHAGLRGGLSDASDSESDSDASGDFDAAQDLGSESEPDSLDLGMSDGEPDDEEGVFDEVLDRKHIPMGDATSRFAAVNMDWDHIKAADLFKVFDSLKPPGAVIHKVSVYPSEFGRERMAHEAQFGPALGGGKSVAMDAPADSESDVESDEEAASKEASEEESDVDDQEDAADPSSRMKRNLRTLEMEEDDTDFDSVALRKYQLERLRYYYAVVECDTVDTAYTIFKAADGAEFEATSNFFDLRFIPDDVSFDEDEPARDVATPESAVAYRPIKFETKALQSSNVKLTWDEDDPDRAQITRKTLSYDELKALDFKDYVASDSDDDADASGGENGGAEDEIAKYRALLGLDGSGSSAGASKGKKKQKRGKAADSDGSDDDSVHGDMEITFTAGLSETAERLMQEREERKKLENETTIEKYERKQRERRQRRKEARMQQEDRSDDDMIGSNVVGGQGGDVADGEELGFDDPFFAMDVDFDDAEEADRLGVSKSKAKNKKDAKKPKVTSVTAEDETNEQPLTKKQKKQSKRKQREEEARREDEEDGVANFSVDASDSRFAPVLAEPEFAIDPTNPHFRDTPGMKSLLKAKRRNAAVKNKEKQQDRQTAAGSGVAAASSNGGAKSNLLALADAVKRKTSAAMDSDAGQGRRNKKVKRA